MKITSSYGVELRKQNIPIRQTLDVYRSAVSYLVEIYAQVWEELEGILEAKKRFNCGENGISRNAVNIRYIEMEYGYRGSVRGTPAGLHMMEQEPLPVIRKITACVYFRQENDIIVICQHRTI